MAKKTKTRDIESDDEKAVFGSQETIESLILYRNYAKKSLQLTIIVSIILTLSVALNIGLVVMRPAPVYFGMNSEMQILPLRPLDDPMINQAALKSWVSEAITQSFNLSFINWRSELSSVQENYTKKAFRDFVDSLNNEGHLPLLKQNRAVMHIVPTTVPVITKHGVISGQYTWELELPCLITYETSKGVISTNNVLLIVRVSRVPTTEYTRGVAISQLVAQQYNPRRD